jgi:hypothetical protein
LVQNHHLAIPRDNPAPQNNCYTQGSKEWREIGGLFGTENQQTAPNLQKLIKIELTFAVRFSVIDYDKLTKTEPN